MFLKVLFRLCLKDKKKIIYTNFFFRPAVYMEAKCT